MRQPANRLPGVGSPRDDFRAWFLAPHPGGRKSSLPADISHVSKLRTTYILATWSSFVIRHSHPLAIRSNATQKECPMYVFSSPLKLRLQLSLLVEDARNNETPINPHRLSVDRLINSGSVGARGLCRFTRSLDPSGDSRQSVHGLRSFRASRGTTRTASPLDRTSGRIAARRRPPPFPAGSANQAINKSNVTNLQSIYKSKKRYP